MLANETLPKVASEHMSQRDVTVTMTVATTGPLKASHSVVSRASDQDQFLNVRIPNPV
jgi:hypothetical protein